MTEAHQIYGHCGRNHLVCAVRKRYWIPNLPSAARRLVSKCVTCRKYHRKAESQKMADLPEQRITVGERPFCCTGMDYFGPFVEIKRDRATQQRYGVIFTCLKTRAVHLEVACSLTINSCIHAIRRFISRRRPAHTIRSDNGTNIVGAQRELQKSLKELDVDKIQRNMLKKGINWQFNPPAASHYGGIWERMIRSSRKAIY
ncbi:uncharacterized protein [Antedon mediterranea]|uniref:uncharacterized protein n=1 Tax=Antedon mediterranea TaxID=105859 RepID=UPI003AF83658